MSAIPVTDRDADLERRMRAALTAHLNATDKREAHIYWQEFTRLHRQREPQRVREMEAQYGLR